MSAFNQRKYIQAYKKEHYKVFKVELKKEDLIKLELYLKSQGLSKAQFLRDCIKAIEEKENKNELYNK